MDSNMTESPINLETNSSNEELIMGSAQGSPSDEELIVGIDLGTTNSCVAIWDKVGPNIVKDSYGHKTIPSIVAFDKNGRLSGYDAKMQIEKNPRNTIYDIKRLIGRNFDDLTVQNDLNYFTYTIDKIADNRDNNIIVKTDYMKKIYTPEEITAIILIKIKKITEKYLKRPVKKAVITIPAYFNDSQRQATKDAAEIAGIECVRMINEPTAAALAYGLNNREDEKDINVIVYDFGGGTLDVSLLNICDGVFQVIAAVGDPHLGGEDFDQKIYEHCLKEFLEKNPDVNPKYYQKNLQKLRVACENAKIMLSTLMETIISVPNFYHDKKREISIDLVFGINRELFETVCKDLFFAAIKPVDDLMFMSKMSTKNIDEIILVGGSTRIPRIQFLLHNYFNKPPCTSVSPDYVVATGASIEGYILSHQDDPFCDDLVLLDVTPLSLGIETINGVMTKIIGRNTPIPVRKTKQFTTEEDDQGEVTIKIYEGERRLTKDNYHVGTFKLTNIEKAKKGVPVINVSINVDVNGIISVTAIDKKSQSKDSVIVSGNKRRLTQEKIQELIIEAQKHEEEDLLKQKLLELYYKFVDLYEMIHYNVVENEESDFPKEDQDTIMGDIHKIRERLETKVKPYKRVLKLYSSEEEKEYYEDSDSSKSIEEIDFTCQTLQNIVNEFSKKIKYIKKRYGSLVMKLTLQEDDENIKSSNAHKDVHVDNDIFDDIEDGEKDEIVALETTNLQHMQQDIGKVRLNTDDDEMVERKKVRVMLHEVAQFLLNDQHKLLDHNLEKLLKYLEDVKIWLNVNVTISKADYKRKAEEIQQYVNQILKENQEEKEESQKLSPKNDLIELCRTLQQGINSNTLGFNAQSISVLQNNIDQTIEFLKASMDYNDDHEIFITKIKDIKQLYSILT